MEAHRYRGVFAPNHTLRSAVTALTIGNVGKPRDAATDGHAVGGHAAGGDTTGDRCDSCDKPRSHDTSRIAWAKPVARVGEEFPLECPGCGGDIRLIALITDPGPIRKILTHLGEQLEPPPVSPARGPPTDWGEPVQVHGDRAIVQATDGRAARDRHPQPLAGSHAAVRPARGKSGFKAALRQRESFDLERGEDAPRHLHDRVASSPISSGACSS